MNLDLPTITAIGSILTPLILAIIAGAGWWIQSRVERSLKIEAEKRDRERSLEEAMRSEQIRIYNAILEPFMMLFAKEVTTTKSGKMEAKSSSQSAVELATSLKYRQTAFQLCMFATDDVVSAYNGLMQYLYNEFKETQDDPVKHKASTAVLLRRLGQTVLEIRRSSGNAQTRLNEVQMLEWLITDIHKYMAAADHGPV